MENCKELIDRYLSSKFRNLNKDLYNIIVAVWKQHYLFLIFETFRSNEAFVWHISTMDAYIGSNALNSVTSGWTSSRYGVWEIESSEVQYIFNIGLYIWSLANVNSSNCSGNPHS